MTKEEFRKLTENIPVSYTHLVCDSSGAAPFDQLFTEGRRGNCGQKEKSPQAFQSEKDPDSACSSRCV